MEVTIAGTTIDVNDEGYLTDASLWNEAVAEAIAAEEEIVLTDKHMEVIRYLRDQEAKGEKLSVRRVGKSGIVSIKEFYDLFPGGPLKKSSRIAGIPKPVSCV